MAEEKNIIKVDDVKKSFKDVNAVNGVSLEVKQGEFLALLGPNGAGKTTLVEMIEGLQHPDSGSITINGEHWNGNKRKLHHYIGLSLQETRLFEKVTVFESLKLFATFYKLPTQRVNEVLEIINLTEKRNAYVENLSGGQRQRLALGIAMLHNAQVLLLDEPTTGLDPTARRDIWNILLNLRKEHKTSLILTTHYMEEAEYLCDRIIIMDKGTILAQGTLDQLLSQNSCHELIEFTLSVDINIQELFADLGFNKLEWDTEMKRGKIWVYDIVSQLPVFLGKVQQHRLNLQSLECRKMTLDDLFIEMTGRRLDQ